MTDLEKALNHITEQIENYRQYDHTGDELVEIQKQITATLFYLQKERSDYHNQFQTLVNRLIINGDSVSRATNKAHVEIPELYMLRKFMDGAYENVWSIKQEISWLKTEKSNIN